MRRCLRFGIRFGLLGGLLMAVLRMAKSRQSSRDAGQVPEPFTPVLSRSPTATASDAEVGAKTSPGGENQLWVEPTAGACPATHPIKGKLKSKLYHLPGMLAYDRTVPDRCYADEAAAEADGLIKAKR